MVGCAFKNTVFWIFLPSAGLFWAAPFEIFFFFERRWLCLRGKKWSFLKLHFSRELFVHLYYLLNIFADLPNFFYRHQTAINFELPRQIAKVIEKFPSVNENIEAKMSKLLISVLRVIFADCRWQFRQYIFY